LEGGISIFPLDKGNKLKEGSRRLTKEEEFVCFFRKKKEEFVCFVWKKEEENECEREELLLMCEKVLFMEKKCVQTKSMEGSCV
jgi:hypothetical protein